MLEFLDFFWIFRFFGFFRFLGFFLLDFLLDFFKLTIRLLLKVTEVPTEHQKLPKRSENSIKTLFCPKGKKRLGRRPKPSTGARNKPA